MCISRILSNGVYHIGQNRYDSLYENVACALLREFDRIMDMFEDSGESE